MALLGLLGCAYSRLAALSHEESKAFMARQQQKLAQKALLIVSENDGIQKTLFPPLYYSPEGSDRLFTALHTLFDEKLNAFHISFHLLPVLSVSFFVFWVCLTVTQIVWSISF